jgi:S-DNA-T family DNA segregation ATPase FtsK/SpoIIIE
MANKGNLWYIYYTAKLADTGVNAFGGVKLKSRTLQKKNYKIKKKNKTCIAEYNHEITGIMLLALGVLMLLSFYLKDSIGLFGNFVREFLLGIMGLPAFLIPPMIIIYAVLTAFKKDGSEMQVRSLYAFCLLVLISSTIQTGYFSYGRFENLSPLECIVQFYLDGQALEGGGVLGGIVSMPFLLLFQSLGTIIILAALSIVNIILLTNISITNFIRNLKRLFTEKNNSKKQIRSTANNQNKFLDTEPDVVGEKDNLNLEFKTRPKIINFKIEKTSRELKERAESIQSPKTDTELMEDEPIELVIKDMKKKSSSVSKKSTEAIGKEIERMEKPGAVYQYPPFALLNENSENGKNSKNYRNIALEGAHKLEETLSSFGVAAKVINVTRGPAVTRYELQPSAGVKVSRIVNLSDDISLNLASSGVRIEAPIPGKAAIGIEVPNKEVTPVLLREVIESEEFINHPSKLAFALGKDISGECIVTDITKMPHLLIAGATGSGKSVCINNLVLSLIYKASPDEVKLLMVDPKVVELGIYNGIPHLLIPVVTDPKKAASALNWAVQEMVNRYKLFADKNVRDIKGYNEYIKSEGEQGLLPQVVIIIDELADLMMVAPNDVEDAVCRLAQMARAAGMHLVIATQRPSVDVITGVIKANIPSRISFAVSSQVDSRTILDMAGAEKLLGRGDMLFYPVGKPKPVRIQGAYSSDKEIEKVVEYVKSQGTAEYDDNIIEEINTESEPQETNSGDNDELLPQAIDMVVDNGQASVSLIQRKFKVGYARAARIVDQMEARGIVGGFEGSKPRQILISKQQWQEMKMADSE